LKSAPQAQNLRKLATGLLQSPHLASSKEGFRGWMIASAFGKGFFNLFSSLAAQKQVDGQFLECLASDSYSMN
jgi:hypothetical protein